MASGDPKIGGKDTWRSDEIIESTETDEIPTLYHYPGSYFSQIARLALTEQGINYRSRAIEIHGTLDHLSAWYLAVSPGACVPTLIHRGKAVPDSRDICYYVSENFSSEINLFPENCKDKINDLFEMHYAPGITLVDTKVSVIECFSMGYYFTSNMFIKRLFLSEMHRSLKQLEILKEGNPHIKETIERKIKLNEERIASYHKMTNIYDDAKKQVNEMLNLLEEKLEGPFICGESYTMADVVFTCFLGRLCLVNYLPAALSSRSKLNAWWNVVKQRKSFTAAEIVTSFSYLDVAGKFLSSCAIL